MSKWHILSLRGKVIAASKSEESLEAWKIKYWPKSTITFDELDSTDVCLFTKSDKGVLFRDHINFNKNYKR